MKKRIVVDGREYGSVDEMPPEVRRTYEELMAGLAEGGAPSCGTRVGEGRLADGSLERVEVTSSRKIVVDGREYDDVGSAEFDEERVHAMLRSAEPRRTRLSRGVGMAVGFGVVLVFVLLILVLGSL